jgi:hypothetical protein
MATQEQHTRVEGSENITITGGRDVELTFYREEKPQFDQPGLKPFRPPAFESPQNADELTQTLHGQRLLVLAGDPELEKSALARHIAWRLGEKLSPEGVFDEVPILEWNRFSGDPQSLAYKIRETEESTIFILPQIAPQDIGYDLLGLRNAAGAKHFVVVSTDVPLPAWKQDPDVIRPFWKDLEPEAVYTTENLADILTRRLIEAKEALASNLLPDRLEPTALLAERISIQDAAAQLRTPNNIAVFVQLLCAEGDVILPGRVQELIDLASDNRRKVQQWYYAVLSPREQLLALGLSLFTDMFDDQFFAALESVVVNVWQRRDASLRALDYCDLDNLRNFFNLIEIGEQTSKIESRLPDQRRMLFEIAWDSHRRQILTALPVITRMVRESVYRIGQDYELYGSQIRRQQLRDVLGETLSDIGLISPHAIQGSLLRLAADYDWRIQAVAAKALARWREKSQDEDLFSTLEEWRLGTSAFAEEVEVEREDEQEENKDERSKGKWANIRSTIALTIGYAARHDPPNQLSPRLLELLGRVSRDHSSLVRSSLAYLTLPMIVPLHLDQLRGVLHGMARYKDLIEGIGFSLASAYHYNPQAVLGILEAWHAEAQQAAVQSAGPDITHREGLLAAVALTYGHIEFTEEIGPLTADEAFSRLRGMLEEERSQFVRSNVVRAIALQANDYFEKVVPLLYEFVHVVTDRERDDIVQIFTNIYLRQRRALEDGEDTIEIDDKSYPVWVESERTSLTKVEQAMFQWIRNPSNPLAQQIATQAFVSFADQFDREEHRIIATMKSERARAAKRAEREQEGVLARGLRHGGLFVDRLVPFLVTINAPKQREIIRGLLPEIVTQARADRELMNLVLERWPRLSRDQEIKDITRRLKLGLLLSKNMNWIVVAILLLLTFLACQCFCLLSSLLKAI